MDISQSVWNESDTLNNTAAPDGAPEGMMASGVNDVIRADRGAIKRWYNQSIPAVTAGSSTVYTLAYGVAPTAIAPGMTHLLQFHTTHGAAATLNVNGLGAKPLFAYIAGTWMAAPEGAFPADYIARVAYDNASGNYRILGMQTCLGVKAFAGNPGVVDFTNVPATANNLRLQFNLLPAGSGANVGLQVFRTGVLATTTYFWAASNVLANGGAVAGAGSNSDGSVTLAASIGTLLFTTGTIQLENLVGNAGIQYQTSYHNGFTLVGIAGSGNAGQSGTLTGIRVGLSSGVASSGTATLFATV